MLKLTSRRKRDLWRLAYGDRYVITKLVEESKRLARCLVARHVVSKQIALAERMSVKFFLAKRLRSEFDESLFFDLDYYSRVAGRRFESLRTAVEHYESLAANHVYIQTHPLFDSAYYAKLVGDTGKLSPIRHFLEYHGKSSVAPTPYFNTQFYLHEYPDVANANINPFVHFMRYGRGELRKPHALFDPAFYLTDNSEKPWSGQDPLTHYLMRLSRGDRVAPHPLINPSYILRQVKALNLPLGDREPLRLYDMYCVSHGVNPHPLFDNGFYLLSLSGGEKSEFLPGETPLAHFLRVCKQEFPLDPSAAFSSRTYWQWHSDIGNVNPLYHYARYGKRELRPISTSLPNFSDADVQTILDIEPTILAPHQSSQKIWSTIYPNKSHPGTKLIAGLLDEIDRFAPDIIFLFSAFRRGGAEKINLRLIETILQQEPRSHILILLTDRAADEAAHWVPRHPNLKTATFSHEKELPEEEATMMLARLLEFLRPRQIINCNSKIGWNVFRDFGAPLSQIAKLRASLFCYDFDVHGAKVGYARDFIRDTIKHLNLVFLDNAKFKQDLVRDFSLLSKDAAKIKVLYQPLPCGRMAAKKSLWTDLKTVVQQPRFLWPMRFHRQKRPDILRAIAAQMRNVQFDVWAPGGEWNSQIGGGARLSNITMLPDFKQSLFDLNLGVYSGVLSTSQWEGLPTVLLECAIGGLPIVASTVGGVGEIVTEVTGYPIESFDNIERYVTAIQQIVTAPQEANRRRIAAYKRVNEQHCTERYTARLCELGFIGTKSRIENHEKKK